jgi:hypothetical protein
MRPAQCSAPRYGYGIYFYEILELSPETYKEELRSEFLPDSGLNVLGTHTFQTAGDWEVTDRQVRRSK